MVKVVNLIPFSCLILIISFTFIFSHQRVIFDFSFVRHSYAPFGYLSKPSYLRQPGLLSNNFILVFFSCQHWPTVTSMIVKSLLLLFDVILLAVSLSRAVSLIYLTSNSTANVSGLVIVLTKPKTASSGFDPSIIILSRFNFLAISLFKNSRLCEF